MHLVRILAVQLWLLTIINVVRAAHGTSPQPQQLAPAIDNKGVQKQVELPGTSNSNYVSSNKAATMLRSRRSLSSSTLLKTVHKQQVYIEPHSPGSLVVEASVNRQLAGAAEAAAREAVDAADLHTANSIDPSVPANAVMLAHKQLQQEQQQRNTAGPADPVTPHSTRPLQEAEQPQQQLQELLALGLGPDQAELYRAIQSASMLRSSSSSTSPSRRLLQSSTSTAPTLCGKIGTYTPNVATAIDGSMFGFSISSSLDGSTVAVGAPVNGNDPKVPGAAFALASRSSRTCDYIQNPVFVPNGTYRYYGAQVALSEDGSTMVILDGVEGVRTSTTQGNRPVVHVYKRVSSGEYKYFQKLNGATRQAMASTLAVSSSANGQLVLVSFSVAQGYTDKRGSAQLFLLSSIGSTAKYTYLQDLALLNMPAGVSTQYGASSIISSNGMTIAVGTAAAVDSFSKYTYMYRRDNFTGQFRIVSAINHGEFYGEPWTVGRGVGLTDDNAVATTQTGRFVLCVEDARLVVYEWGGSGMSMLWQRRCQLAAPEGYVFRTTGAALSIVEVSSTRVKFAAGAYLGALDQEPSSMAVFLYYLNIGVAGSCPYRHAEKHVHNDPYSNYGAAVTITPNGNLLLIGAPSAWDNNMQKQYGAVYTIDISTVDDDGLVAKVVTAAKNTYAGCVAGKDSNGNPCVAKTVEGTEECKIVTKADGTVIRYGPAGCTPASPKPSFWTPPSSGTYIQSPLSAYSTTASSTKGGVAVPVGMSTWLANQVTQAAQSAYYGYPVSATSAKTSVIEAAGWQSSVVPVGGGLGTATAANASTAVSTPGTISVLSTMLQGLGGVVSGWLGGSGGAAAATGTAGLPSGAVITNLGVLNGGNTGG